MRCTDAHRNAGPRQSVPNACVQTPVSRSTTTVSLPPARSPFLKRVGKGVCLDQSRARLFLNLRFQTLWSTSSSSKVWNKRWSSGNYFGNDVTLTCPDNWRRSVLMWHTGELRVPFDKLAAPVVKEYFLKFQEFVGPFPTRST